MKKIKIQEQKEVYDDIIKLLVKHKTYWEERARFDEKLKPLMPGWRFPELWEIEKYTNMIDI